MNLISSDIVNSSYDVFWDDISPKINDVTPKPVLILVSKYNNGSPEEAQLLKMIEACQLGVTQYNIIQLANDEKLAWHGLREKLDPKIIFLVGIYPIQLGISSLFCLNEPNSFNDRTWLPTLSITELEKNKDVKKQLWLGGITPVFINKKFGEI